MALNHWNSGVSYENAPKYVISIHSSNPVLVDQVAMPRYTLSDALFLMVEKLGKKHVVRLFVKVLYCGTIPGDQTLKKLIHWDLIIDTKKKCVRLLELSTLERLFNRFYLCIHQSVP